jgi:hypothetical protein
MEDSDLDRFTGRLEDREVVPAYNLKTIGIGGAVREELGESVAIDVMALTDGRMVGLRYLETREAHSAIERVERC